MSAQGPITILGETVPVCKRLTCQDVRAPLWTEPQGRRVSHNGRLRHRRSDKLRAT
jgi:hypothetical protein